MEGQMLRYLLIYISVCADDWSMIGPRLDDALPTEAFKIIYLRGLVPLH